jgi:hypothetical protein
MTSCGPISIADLGGSNSQNNTKTEGQGRSGKTALGLFNVVTFPNNVCSSSSGYNGTCYTATECTSLGGTSSGSCAQSFGVCCVFTMDCGGTTSQNNSYAIISSYSTTTDTDPCKYTICRSNSNVCKIRIDFDTMVLSGPYSTTAANTDGMRLGDCENDNMRVTSPGYTSSPVICGYNTGQHMFVPASDSCNVIDINVDTGVTTTTRKWIIRITQYECGNLAAPEQDCLQYHSAQKGTIANFNWDTTATTLTTTSQYHLSSQYYDICFRRTRGYCSICFSPQIIGTSTSAGSSYGLGASAVVTTLTSAVGTYCTGYTLSTPTVANGVGWGDYIEIANWQTSIGTTGTIGPTGVGRMCGVHFNTVSPTRTQATSCSWSTPFKMGVHFDANESIDPTFATAANYENVENNAFTACNPTTPACFTGTGYMGFYLAYWQNAC